MTFVRALRATFVLLLLLATTAVPCRAETVPPTLTIPLAVYAAALRSINPHLAVAQSLAYAQALVACSRKWRLDPSLVMALVAVESHWNSRAVSYTGAQGLGQLEPGTARELGVDPKQARSNLQGTTLYLHHLLGVFRATRDPIRAALAGYNAGPEAVRAAGGIPPIYETRHYVVKVMGAWHHLKHKLDAHAVRVQPASGEPGADPAAALAYWGVR